MTLTTSTLMYNGNHEELRIWTRMISYSLKYLIGLLNSFNKTYGTSPNPDDITKVNFHTLSEELAKSLELQEKFVNIRDTLSPRE